MKNHPGIILSNGSRFIFVTLAVIASFFGPITNPAPSSAAENPTYVTGQEISINPEFVSLPHGRTQQFTLKVRSESEPPNIELTIPNGLDIQNGVQCEVELFGYPTAGGGDARLAEFVSSECEGGYSSDTVSGEVTLLAHGNKGKIKPLNYTMTLNFSIGISEQAAPGEELEIARSTRFDTEPIATISVVEKGAPLATTAAQTPATIDIVNTPFGTEKLEARPGDVVTITFDSQFPHSGAVIRTTAMLPPSLKLVGDLQCSASNEYSCLEIQPRPVTNVYGKTQLDWRTVGQGDDAVVHTIMVRIPYSAEPGEEYVVTALLRHQTSPRNPVDNVESEITIHVIPR